MALAGLLPALQDERGDDVLSYYVPAAMLEDLLNEGDPIPAFDFFGETFVLSPGLEEKGGGLVFIEEQNPKIKIWKGDDGFWYRNEGDGEYSAKWKLPPPDDVEEAKTLNASTDEEIKGTGSFPLSYDQDWISAKQGADPPFDLGTLYEMIEPGDSATLPEKVCQNHALRVTLGWVSGTAVLSTYCIVANSEQAIKVLGGEKRSDWSFGSALTMNKAEHLTGTISRLSDMTPLESELVIDLARLPTVVESLWIVVCAESFDFSKVSVIEASIALVKHKDLKGTLPKGDGIDGDSGTEIIRVKSEFDENYHMYEPSLVFLRLRRLPSYESRGPSEWQIVAVGTSCEGRSGRAEETLDACDLDGFLGDSEYSNESVAIEKRTMMPRTPEPTRRQRKEKAKAIREILPYIDYKREFTKVLGLVLSRASKQKEDAGVGWKRLESTLKQQDNQRKAYIYPTTMAAICAHERVNSQKQHGGLLLGHKPQHDAWLTYFIGLRERRGDDKWIRNGGNTLAIIVKQLLTDDYDKEMAAKRGDTMKAAECFKQHLHGMLDLPLQTLTDDSKKRKKYIPTVCKLLDDPKWWYSVAVIDPIQEVYAEKLLEEIRTANQGNRLEELRKKAENSLKDDLSIYTAIRFKETHADGYTELAEFLHRLEMQIREKYHNVKPLQPVADGTDDTIMTVAQAKAHAARAHPQYREIINEVKKLTGVGDKDVLIAPMKGSFRMIQKSIYKPRVGTTHQIGNCRGVCDINRALIKADNPLALKKIVDTFVDFDARDKISIKWMKDRINQPTDGGWCDVLFLFSVTGSNGHVCEIQIAFKAMCSAREEGAGHRAYAEARNAIETIEAAGGQFAMQSAANDIRILRNENAALKARIKVLEAQTAQLEASKSRFSRDGIKSKVKKHRRQSMRRSNTSVSEAGDLNQSSGSENLHKIMEEVDEGGDHDGAATPERQVSDMTAVAGESPDVFATPAVTPRPVPNGASPKDLAAYKAKIAKQQLTIEELKSQIAAAEVSPLRAPNGEHPGGPAEDADTIARLQFDLRAARLEAHEACKQQMAIVRQKAALEARVAELSASSPAGGDGPKPREQSPSTASPSPQRHRIESETWI
eukprot:m.41292 g.41292  ORF g.41292 m.41292 type:complete len:1105 (+) comp8196_c0_seq1:178-3492(+)